MKTITIKPKVLYFGTPVALITTVNPDGSANISPMSSLWALNDRIVLGVGTEGQCLANLERVPECVINLPGPEQWHQVEAIASCTGRYPVPAHKVSMGYVFEADKFLRAGFDPLTSECVTPPRIAQCPLQLEVKVMSKYRFTDVNPENPETTVIVETRVLRVHAHQNIVIPETDHVDTEQWSPLLYVFRHYFGGGVALGKNFRA